MEYQMRIISLGLGAQELDQQVWKQNILLRTKIHKIMKKGLKIESVLNSFHSPTVCHFTTFRVKLLNTVLFTEQYMFETNKPF